MWRRRPFGRLLGASLSLLALTAACSKGNAGTTTPPTATSPAIVTTLPTSPPTSPPSSPAAGGQLSGTWKGQYSGAFQGTFTLAWVETGASLIGTIDLGSNGGIVPINGTVDGNDIRFGTVGSTNITYSGSVSGDSMSGTYQVHATNGGSSGGPWSATKSP